MSLLQLKDDAVALVDVFAPPDFILNSPIGCADGQVKPCRHIKLKSPSSKTLWCLFGANGPGHAACDNGKFPKVKLKIRKPAYTTDFNLCL